MANTKKNMSREWKKIRTAVSDCKAVDQKVVDLLVGLGHMPLSEAAEKVKEAAGFVLTYVTGVNAVVDDVEDLDGSTMVDQASQAKDNLYAAVEDLRNVMAEVKHERFTPPWDEIKEDPEFLSSDSEGHEIKDEPKVLSQKSEARLQGLLDARVRRTGEHFSSVTRAIRNADGAANSALAVIALATKEVEEAPDAAARTRMVSGGGRLRMARASIPGYLLCHSCSRALLYCNCSKSERDRKRARDSEEESDEGPRAKVKVEVAPGC